MPKRLGIEEALDFEQLLTRIHLMDKAKEAQIAAHALALAALLYEETASTNPEQLKSLDGIEAAIRGHMQQRVNPTVAIFLSQKAAARQAGAAVGLPASSGS